MNAQSILFLSTEKRLSQNVVRTFSGSEKLIVSAKKYHETPNNLSLISNVYEYGILKFDNDQSVQLIILNSIDLAKKLKTIWHQTGLGTILLLDASKGSVNSEFERLLKNYHCF